MNKQETVDIKNYEPKVGALCGGFIEVQSLSHSNSYIVINTQHIISVVPNGQVTLIRCTGGNDYIVAVETMEVGYAIDSAMRSLHDKT